MHKLHFDSYLDYLQHYFYKNIRIQLKICLFYGTPSIVHTFKELVTNDVSFQRYANIEILLTL